MMIRMVFFAGVMLLLGACSLAPTYERPKMSTANTFQEAGSWIPAHTLPPAHTDVWWESFNDPTLNQLETQAQTANQSLLAAAARLAQARAIARAQHARLMPDVTAGATHQNGRISSNRPLFPKGLGTGYQDNLVGVDVNYEIDIWGALRNASTASAALAAASADDLAALHLSIQAELATDYFNLRGTDAELGILQQWTNNWQSNEQLTQQQLDAGAVNQANVAQAQQSLNDTLTQLAALRLTRQQLQHAIALIIGANPDTFSLPVTHHFDTQALHPNLGLPSTLLERRPDIASAERAVVAANANIGVARAAFFPVFSLDAALGYENNSSAAWLNAPNQFWSLGPSMVLTLFDGGRLQALSDLARAQWQETAANYRKAVLTAWREVEDDLSNQRELEQEALSAQQSLNSAQTIFQQAQYRYEAGLGNQLDVLQTERTVLSSTTQNIGIHTQRIINSIALVKALGGGWRTNKQE